MVFVFGFLCDGAFSDTISLADGSKRDGKILSYHAQMFAVQGKDGIVFTLPVAHVASFTVDTTNETSTKLDHLEKEVTSLLKSMEDLSSSSLEGNNAIRSDVYGLNPVSRISIARKEGFFKGADFMIEGELKNQSGVFVRGVGVKAVFYNQNGQIVFEKEIPLMVSVLTPGGFGRFNVQLKKPPSFATYELQILEGSPQTTEEIRSPSDVK